VHELTIALNLWKEVFIDAVSAKQDVLVIKLLFEDRIGVLVVVPVLALVTLNHVLVHLLKWVGFLAVAVAIEKGLVVDVLVIGQIEL